LNPYVDPKYLTPLAPRAAWDGWFAIAMFPAGSPLRWLKAHAYRRDDEPGRFPFSLVEGMGEQTEVMIAWANADEVEVKVSVVEPEPLTAAASPLRVALGESFLLEGKAPDYRMTFTLPANRGCASFNFRTGWPIWWAKFGPMLQYVGQHSGVSVDFPSRSVSGNGSETLALDGFGVMEHVAGASASFDFTGTPLHFHWDVLAFDDAQSPFDSAAGLSIGMGGRTIVPLKAAARFPGSEARGMRGLWVKYREVTTGVDEAGNAIMVPVRWEGLMRSSQGTFRYEATAATPVAGIVPGGGMLGFDFEGRWTTRGSNRTTLRGYGFNEYGDFSGALEQLARRESGGASGE